MPQKCQGRKEKITLPGTPDKYGVIPFTTLDIPHAFNPNVAQPTMYQANFLKFTPITVSKTDELRRTVREAIQHKSPLDREHLNHLRQLYATIVQGRGKREIETGLLTQLCHKIDKTYYALWNWCVKKGDKDLLKVMIEEAEADPLLGHLIKKSTNLEEVKAKFPEVQAAFIARTRNELDAGAGGRRQSAGRRPSSAALDKEIRKEKAEGWHHITFNPETGRLNLTSELKFAKVDEHYHESLPTSAEFEDPELAEEVLKEIVQIWKTFRVKFDVVQVHKSPYTKEEQEEEGEHEEWLINLAKARAKKLRNTLEELGVPKGEMSAKVETVDKTAVMQYCSFKMAWIHVNFNHSRMLITSKCQIMWAQRTYTEEHYDEPTAELEELVLTKALCKEVVQIAQYYRLQVAVVVHDTESAKAVGEEHRHWLQALHQARADKLKELLLDQDLEKSKINTRVIGEEFHDTVSMCRACCVSCHFELIKDRKDNHNPAAAVAKPQEHFLHVHGAGLEEFNGTYLPNGTCNNQIQYRLGVEGAEKQTITKDDQGFWCMCYNHDVSTAIYKLRGDLHGKHVNSWKHAKLGATGMLPEVELVYEMPKKGRIAGGYGGGGGGGGGYSPKVSRNISARRTRVDTVATTVTFKHGT